MKVFVYSDVFSRDGSMAGLFARDQIRALRLVGVNVVGISVDIRSIRRWRKWGFDKFYIDDIPIYSINLPVGRCPIWFYQRLVSFLFTHFLKYVIRKEDKPSIVHAHFGTTGSTAVDVCKKLNIPLVVTEHGSNVLNSSQRSKVYRYLSKAYDYASKIIVVSSQLGRVISKEFGKTTITIPNIVDVEAFQGALNLKRANSSEGKFKFISIGNLIPGKGFCLLIDAFNSILNLFPNVSLDIIGDGPERKSLENQINRLGVNDKVTLRGRLTRTQIKPLLASSDCFVLSSKRETFGVVYIEALACGVPVIATDCGGPSDIVTSENGLLIPVDDKSALVDAMKKMIDNVQEYDRKSISEKARLCYAPERIGSQVYRVFETVVENVK